ncbi:hypothetical protein OSJ57_11245 [Sphingomonas sp. HH69]
MPRNPRFLGETPLDLPVGPPKILSMPQSDDGLSVEYWRTGWRKIDSGYRVVKQRTTRAMLLVAGKTVGQFDFREFKVEPYTSNDLFFLSMDEDSQSTSDLASVLCANWEDIEEITDYGDILELHRAWIHPSYSRKGRLTRAILATIDALHAKHALFILKAFPLEYEGKTDDNNFSDFRRRQAALMRHYQKTLGVQPLPNPSDIEGWMYAIPERLRRAFLPMPCAQ